MTLDSKRHYFDVLDTQKSTVKYYYIKNGLLHIPIINAGIFDHELNPSDTVKNLPAILLVFENVANFTFNFYDMNRLRLRVQNIGVDSDYGNRDCFGFNIVDSKYYLEIEINSDSTYFHLISTEYIVDFEELENTLDLVLESNLTKIGKFKFSDLQEMAMLIK